MSSTSEKTEVKELPPTAWSPYCLSALEMQEIQSPEKVVDKYICITCGNSCSSSVLDSASVKEKLSRMLALHKSYLMTSVDNVVICPLCKKKTMLLLDTFALFADVRERLKKLSSEICKSIAATHLKLRKGSTPEEEDQMDFEGTNWNVTRINSMLTRCIFQEAGTDPTDPGLDGLKEDNSQFVIEIIDVRDNDEANRRMQEYEYCSINVGRGEASPDCEGTVEVDESVSEPGERKSDDVDGNGNLSAKYLGTKHRRNSPVKKRNRNDPVKHYCNNCDKRFSSLWSLTRHQKLHSQTGESVISVKKIYDSGHCTKIFSDATKLRDHQKKHRAELNFCPICKKEVSRGTLADHLHRHHIKDIQYAAIQCSICSKEFGSPLLLCLHIEVHKGEFSCKNSSCRKGFTTTDQLLRHEAVHVTHPKLLSCDFCAEVFDVQNKIKFDDHMSTHKKFSTERFLCDNCGKIFPTKPNLNRHIRSLHKNVFKCDVCDKIFSSKSNLTCHQRLHMGSASAPFACQECNLQFFQKVSLDSHNLRKHKGVFPYSCDHCDHPGFTYIKGFRLHMFKSHPNIYTLSKKFVCTICYKLFEEEVQLEEHSQSHAKLKCKICDKQFKMKTHLDEHLLRHSTLGFVREKELSAHMEKIHPEMNYSYTTASKVITCQQIQIE